MRAGRDSLRRAGREHRPYGTGIIGMAGIPTLKRGANDRCASGADDAPRPHLWRRPAEEWGRERLIRAAEAMVLAIAICFSLGASDASARFNNLGRQLMCQCGCAQLLGGCDHIGCPDRDGELRELSAAIASGVSDQQILDGFAAKYGATVLAAPPAKGFDLVAWIAPFAVFAAALLGTILLIRRWAGPGPGIPTAAVAGAPQDPGEQERLERIRRETGGEGGF